MNNPTTNRSLKGYFQMLRTKDWIVSTFWALPIGAVLIYPSLKIFISVAVIAFCITAYSYAVNNYFDVEIDRKHKGKVESGKNPLAQGLISPKGTKVLLKILVLIPLVLAFQVNFTGFIFVALSILASTFYSAKPFRFKEKPGLDIITSALMFGLFPFFAGVTLAGGSINLLVILGGTLFTIINAAGLVAHHITDYHHDMGNTKTFAIKIGLKKSYVCLILLILSSLLCFEAMLQFFTITWWLHYSIIIFLIFCLPVRYIYLGKIKSYCFSKI